eukprot:scaffold238099_cov14-Tisochrysis_lutea.AAC.1
MFSRTPDDLDMHIVYDVSHNIAKVGEKTVTCLTTLQRTCTATNPQQQTQTRRDGWKADRLYDFFLCIKGAAWVLLSCLLLPKEDRRCYLGPAKCHLPPPKEGWRKKDSDGGAKEGGEEVGD